MKPPIYVRTFTDEERKQLEAGLHSPDAFVLRRCQIMMASARGEHATTIERNVGCDDDTVRKVIKAFNAHGLAALKAKSRRPTTLARRLLLSQASGSKKSCTKARVRTAKIPACGPWN